MKGRWESRVVGSRGAGGLGVGGSLGVGGGLGEVRV